MEKLPKDLKRKLALELSPQDLIVFCSSNRELNRDICESKEFWRLKLDRDYPEVFPYFRKYGKVLVDPKRTYIKKFRELSQPIDEFVNRYPEAWRRRLHNDIYDLYERNKNSVGATTIGNALDGYDFRDENARRDFKNEVTDLISRLVRLYNVYRV